MAFRTSKTVSGIISIEARKALLSETGMVARHVNVVGLSFEQVISNPGLLHCCNGYSMRRCRARAFRQTCRPFGKVRFVLVTQIRKRERTHPSEAGPDP